MSDQPVKIKQGFVLRTVAGSHVVVPIGSRVVDFNALIVLNETGRALWELLATGSDLERLTEALSGRFEVTREQARGDAAAFVAQLAEKGLLEDAPDE